MAIDWDTLVIGPLMDVFGEPVHYLPAAGSPIYTGQALAITAVLDEASLPVQLLDDPSVLAVMPVLGVRLSEFPAGYDPREAQGDTFVARGRTYVVKAGKPDSHGGARLEANWA